MLLFGDKQFETKEDLFAHLVVNKSKLISMKKATLKTADSIIIGAPSVGTAKALKGTENEIAAIVVINTTKVFDSHSDVHFDGLWDKSLNENKNPLHLQEHNLTFDKIISDGDDLKAYVEMKSFKELGFNFEGKTQALIFESNIRKDRNPVMFGQYSKGFVKNHSVGMHYVKLALCINSDNEEYGAEKEAWDKYFPQILVGQDKAESQGYFWAVTEAKMIEGSAVPVGSNTLTPTLESKEPLKGTLNHKGEPQRRTLNYLSISKHLKS